MGCRIVTTVRSCFTAVRQIRSVRCSLTRQTLLSLVRALIVSKVDYCNSVLAGISAVHAECRHPADLLGKEVRIHLPVTL